MNRRRMSGLVVWIVDIWNFKKILWNSKYIFAPHFGWKAKKLLAEPKVSYQDRKYELFFPASNVRWEEDVAYRYLGLTGALRTIAEETIRFLLEHIEICLEEAMEAVLTRYGETEVLELSKECLEAAGEYIDFYVRIHARNQVIRSLLNAGMTVTVCGRNWSEFPKMRWKNTFTDSWRRTSI